MSLISPCITCGGYNFQVNDKELLVDLALWMHFGSTWTFEWLWAVHIARFEEEHDWKQAENDVDDEAQGQKMKRHEDTYIK